MYVTSMRYPITPFHLHHGPWQPVCQDEDEDVALVQASDQPEDTGEDDGTSHLQAVFML